LKSLHHKQRVSIRDFKSKAVLEISTCQGPFLSEVRIEVLLRGFANFGKWALAFFISRCGMNEEVTLEQPEATRQSHAISAFKLLVRYDLDAKS
jgi:hypothetical protein